MSSAIEQIYNQLMEVFGGTNPNQMFTMLMPGTTLDPKIYTYDTLKEKPATVQEAESKLVNQMFDVAKVSGGSNGERVPNQYLQALSVLVPKFNPMMPEMKNILRDYINTPVPPNTLLNGNPFKGSQAEYYFMLYEGWIAVKEAWDNRILAKKNELSREPETENEKFLEWYEETAEGELAKIDEAMGKVLAFFSPADMNAILGALASGPGGEVEEAANIVRDIRLASPGGGYFYPVDLLPTDWFLDLASDIDPVDLLKDPEFIAATITAKRRALQASISQIQALIDKMPKSDTIQRFTNAFREAQKAYTKSQNNLLNTYTDNAVTAVVMYLAGPGGALLKEKLEKSPESSIDQNDVDKVNKNAIKVDAAKKSDPTTVLTADNIKKIANGQKELIQAQSALLTSSQDMANAGFNLAAAESAQFGDLPMLLARLQTQLAEIQAAQDQLATAASSTRLPPDIGIAYDAKTKQAAQTVLGKAQVAAAAANATAETVKNAVSAAVTDSEVADKMGKLNIAANSASQVTAKIIVNAVEKAIKELPVTISENDKKNAQEAFVAAKAAAEEQGATQETVKEAVSENVGQTTSLASLTTAANNAKPTAQDVLNAITTEVNAILRPPVVKQSDASERFMEMQFSFNNTELDKSSVKEDTFTQIDWSVNLFLGSARGSNQTSSGLNHENAFEKDTEIKIGLKAAKVDILRDWFDPGVFKLSADMNRLSTEPISYGTNWTQITDNINKAILPAFPVAFVVVKDVTITFQASESQLDAMHKVLDNQSAAGGGFLCFSVSSASRSKSDSSRLHTKSTGTVITIHMPAPQILGWFLELLPKDESTTLSLQETVAANEELTITNFVKRLVSLSQAAAKSRVAVTG